jgi:lactoylglutathione lyase
MNISYGYTILYVADVKATLAFYQEAFGFREKFLTPEHDYGELDTGSTTLAFAAYSMASYNEIAIRHTGREELPPPCELVFVTDDIQGSYTTALHHGAVPIVEPREKPWGQTVAYVRDCNGFLIELCTPMQG